MGVSGATKKKKSSLAKALIPLISIPYIQMYTATDKKRARGSL